MKNYCVSNIRDLLLVFYCLLDENLVLFLESFCVILLKRNYFNIQIFEEKRQLFDILKALFEPFPHKSDKLDLNQPLLNP
jgi:hypothetical protein